MHKKMKQSIVAKEIGLNATTLNAYLNDRIPEIRKSKYFRLCDLLGIDVLF
ncbi:helix-turn-helix domain-containing protein [Sutcliffiella halmapala]